MSEVPGSFPGPETNKTKRKKVMEGVDMMNMLYVCMKNTTGKPIILYIEYTNKINIS